jgi:hypothetical protein
MFDQKDQYEENLEILKGIFKKISHKDNPYLVIYDEIFPNEKMSIIYVSEYFQVWFNYPNFRELL